MIRIQFFPETVPHVHFGISQTGTAQIGYFIIFFLSMGSKFMDPFC
jgi:hypothetical protein